jgi:hypothetical protein
MLYSSIIEYCVALMVGCAPAIYAYWTKFRPAAKAARNAQVKTSDSVSGLVFPGSSTTVGQGSLTGYGDPQSQLVAWREGSQSERSVGQGVSFA